MRVAGDRVRQAPLGSSRILDTPVYARIGPPELTRRNAMCGAMSGSILQRWEVAELIHRYADSLNHRDFDCYTDCWIEASVFKQTIANQDEAPQQRVATIERPISLEARG